MSEVGINFEFGENFQCKALDVGETIWDFIDKDFEEFINWKIVDNPAYGFEIEIKEEFAEKTIKRILARKKLDLTSHLALMDKRCNKKDKQEFVEQCELAIMCASQHF